MKFLIKNFKILSISLIVYLFLMNTLYNSNLSTANVIVDISSLLSNEDKLLKTDREFCLLEPSDTFYFINAKKGSLAHKIYSKIDEKDVCIFFNNDKLGNLHRKNVNKLFFVIGDHYSFIVSKYSQALFKQDSFRSSVPLYESLRAFILSKSMKKQIKKYVNQWTSVLFDYGFMIEVAKTLNIVYITSGILDLEKTGGKDGFLLYNLVQDYIDDNTLVETLKFNKIKLLFIIYFAILISILIIYLIHCFIMVYFKILKRKFKTLINRIKNVNH